MHRKHSLSPIILLALCSGTSAQVVLDREGTWDIGIHLIDTGSETLTGDRGSTIDVDSELGWGFSAIYNFNERLGLGIESSWVKPNYLATRVLEDTLRADTLRAELMADADRIGQPPLGVLTDLG